MTRLAGHKGIDLLCYIAERLLQRRVQLAVLGTGEEKYEWFLSGLQYRFPQQVAAHLVFDADLADLAYAAADLYLMPSKAEPCGLSQLIAMRYGTVPVVNATGGLRDTVTPYDPTTGAGRGFTFQSYNADDFLASIDRRSPSTMTRRSSLPPSPSRICWSIRAGRSRPRNICSSISPSAEADRTRIRAEQE